MSDHQEIVIVKRHNGDHDDHHGGAWKIAFADFMTAMMAFFLVMWLIAANDKTRATVARYFNPVKLVDATVRKHGLQDPKIDDTASPVGHSTDGNSSSLKSPQHSSPPAAQQETAKGREARLDNAMRSNPFAALAEIAGSKGPGEAPPRETPGSAPVIGHKGGPAFRDPFAPPPAQSTSIPDKDDDVLTITPPKRVPRAIVPPPTESKDETNPDPDSAPTPAAAAEPTKLQKKDEDLTKQLMASLKTPGARDTAGPDIKVRRTSEGFLVSLTDTGNFSMFANASAVPSRRVVLLMEHVGKILASKPGGVVIRGFTDNKPFRSGRYDNWNLSIDRAQAAHYMLVRGGLKDARITGVEGFADRGAQDGIDPASPLNRRIEILLKDDQT